MPQPKSPNGCIVWEGNSLVDNAPIVLILTGLERPSQNRKTGPMVQSFVIRQDIEPLEAVLTQKDSSVCDQCPLKRGTCYVDLRPINTIWRKYAAGEYPYISQQVLTHLKNRRKLLRITAYGEATVIPFEVWEKLFKWCKPGTGYTHRWQVCDTRWQKFLMASIETPAQAYQAWKLGWRTFRAILPEEPLLPGEILCKNYTHKWVTCEDCLLCNGTRKKAANIADPVHGLGWKLKNYEAVRGIKIIRSRDSCFPDFKEVDAYEFKIWQWIVDTLLRLIVARRGCLRDGWNEQVAQDFIRTPYYRRFHFDYASAYLRNQDPLETAYTVLEKIEAEGWIP